MKSQKGITLISLTIYIIVMAAVVGVVAIISTFFFSNMSDVNDVINPITEYTKFNTFFSEEVNHSNIKVLECGTTNSGQNYIVFNNGVQYTYIPENKGIYKNCAKIARGVDNCTFTKDIKNGKDIVKVVFTSGNKIRENTYTLKN